MGKYAVLIHAGPDRPGSALNGIEYAIRLADEDHDVRVYLDGPATRWPAELQKRADHPLHDRLSRSLDGDITVGACAFCAAAIDDARVWVGIEFADQSGADLRTDVIPVFYRHAAGFHCGYR